MSEEKSPGNKRLWAKADFGWMDGWAVGNNVHNGWRGDRGAAQRPAVEGRQRWVTLVMVSGGMSRHVWWCGGGRWRVCGAPARRSAAPASCAACCSDVAVVGVQQQHGALAVCGHILAGGPQQQLLNGPLVVCRHHQRLSTKLLRLGAHRLANVLVPAASAGSRKRLGGALGGRGCMVGPSAPLSLPCCPRRHAAPAAMLAAEAAPATEGGRQPCLPGGGALTCSP